VKIPQDDDHHRPVVPESTTRPVMFRTAHSRQRSKVTTLPRVARVASSCCDVASYPLVNIQKAIEAMAIEIVDLPIYPLKKVTFHSYVNVWKRHLEKNAKSIVVKGESMKIFHQ